MWGEGGHKEGKNGEKWIFLPEIFFFDFYKKRMKKIKNFCQSKCPNLCQILPNLGQNGSFFNSRQKIETVFFSPPETRLHAKN